MIKDLHDLRTAVRTALGALDIAAAELNHAVHAGVALGTARAAMEVACSELNNALAATNTELTAALLERDAALASCKAAFQEMHHRVGNILGVATAAVRLHDKPGIDTKALREQALERIYAIADQHQQIARPLI